MQNSKVRSLQLVYFRTRRGSLCNEPMTRLRLFALALVDLRPSESSWMGFTRRKLPELLRKTRPSYVGAKS